MKEYNKLIRDGIIDIIEKDGRIAYTRVLDESEYKAELKKKLKEETEELMNACEDQLLEELADVYEVLEHITEAYEISFEKISEIKMRKASERGKFSHRLFLIGVKEKV